MQRIQDKDFDQLFKDKFEEAQIEPSAELWSKIEHGIGQKRKHVPVYWMAAAAVIAVLSIGLVFFNRSEKVKIEGPEIAVQKPVDKLEIPRPVIPAPVVGNKVKPIVPRTAGIVTRADSAGLSRQKSLKVVQPVQVIARLTTKPAVVEEQISVLPEEPVVAAKEELMIASTDVPVVTKDEILNENDMADKKGIRNVGDLINYVVDKVDKREDKVIQFKTDNDDNSSLVGINLGMIRFSHKRHK